MVKPANLLIVAALSLGHSLALAQADDLESRDIMDFDTLPRSLELEDMNIIERDLYYPPTQIAREFDDLSERSPGLFGKIFGGIKRTIFGRDFDVDTFQDLSERELDDLYARALDSLSIREIEELAERSPGLFGKIFGGIKRTIFGRDDVESFEDLAGREESFDARDFDEFEDVFERDAAFDYLEDLD